MDGRLSYLPSLRYGNNSRYGIYAEARFVAEIFYGESAKYH
jgi:hypothetical protein